MGVFKKILPFIIFSMIWSSLEFFLPVMYLKKINVYQISILFFLSSSIGLILDAPAGRLSDIVGRKFMLVYSMIFALLGLLSLFGNSFLWFFIASISFGISYGMNWSPMLAYIGDVSKRLRVGETFGSFISIDSLDEVIAPILIALILAYFSLYSVVLLLLVFTLIFLFVALIFIKDKKRPMIREGLKFLILKEHLYIKEIHDIIKNSRSILPLLFISFFIAFTWESIWFVEPIQGAQNNSLLNSAVTVSFFSIPFVILGNPIGKLVDKFGVKKMLITSSLILGFSMCLFSALNKTFWGTVVIFVGSIGLLGIWEILDVCITEKYKKNERGEFFGITETIKDLGYAISPPIIALISAFGGFNSVFLTVGILGLLIIPLSLKID
ncbi:MAG: MFS transporter [Candidatus Aenigmarchaeota archaeon]|nr:MFS transporter [Candidatus Aenigmarchaeota archaeon]